jgi:uncharacterized protein YjlB
VRNNNNNNSHVVPSSHVISEASCELLRAIAKPNPSLSLQQLCGAMSSTKATSCQCHLASHASLKVGRHLIPAYNGFPNTSLAPKPLLIYRGAFEPPASTEAIESHLAHIGVVQPAWRYSMYRQHHYHSTTHEVLCVSRGSAKLCFGGPENPGRVETTVEHGDAIVVPAGVAHALLAEGRDGFEMVGSYPRGCQQWDMCTGRTEERSKWKTIEALKWFEHDPLYGEGGPAVREL